MRKSILFFVAAILLAGCADKNASYSQNSSSTHVESGYYLVKKGVTEYSVLLSDEPTTNAIEAANEIVTYINKSTGAEMPIIHDSEYVDGLPVISLGETLSSKSKGITSQGMDLGSSGYYIKTNSNSLYILGQSQGNDNGVCYGAYDFLYDAIGYRYYARDEVAYDIKGDVSLYKYDKSYRPSFDYRSIAFYDTENDYSHRHHLRLINMYSNQEEWALFGHTQIRMVMSKAVHDNQNLCGNTGGKQLCWSYGHESEELAAEGLWEYIKSKPKATYFMFGQEDVTEDFDCSCDRCQKAKAEYACNDAGLQLIYMRHVIEILHDKYLDKPDFNRDIRFVVFAYLGTEIPPTKSVNGEIAPYSSEIYAPDDLYIMYTPISMSFGHPIDSKTNESVRDNLDAWHRIVGDRIIVYTYTTNYTSYFSYFNNYDYFHTQAKEYKNDFGVDFLMYQGAIMTNQPTFQEMIEYVESSLLWDLGGNYDELVDEFIDAYYQEAGKYIREYYDFIRARTKEYELDIVGNKMTSIYSDLCNSSIYNYQVTNHLNDIINNALSSLDKSKENYLTLCNRVQRIRLAVLYYYLSFHQGFLSNSEISEYRKDFYYYCDLFEIKEYREGYPLAGMFN